MILCVTLIDCFFNRCSIVKVLASWCAWLRVTILLLLVQLLANATFCDPMVPEEESWMAGLIVLFVILFINSKINGFFCGFVSEFRALSDEELDAMLVPKEAYDDNALAVVARCTPADKQRLVRRLRLVKFHLQT